MHRVALCGIPYAGKSTLRKELVNRGYVLIDFGQLLKKHAAAAIKRVTGEDITSSMIDQDKARYRGFLQELGNVIGFNCNPTFVLQAIEPYTGNLRVVFDCVRTPQQFEVLAARGFSLVEVTVPRKTQWERARIAGVSEGEFSRLLSAPLEQGFLANEETRCLVDLILDGRLDPTMLASLVEGAHQSDLPTM